MANATKDLEKLSTHVHFRGGVNMGIGTFNLVRALRSIHNIKAKEPVCGLFLSHSCTLLQPLLICSVILINSFICLYFIFLSGTVSASIQSPETDGVFWFLRRQGR